MPRVDPFYADDDVDAVRLISKQEQRRDIEEGIVIDAPDAGQIAVRLAGSSRTIPVDPLVGTKLNRGDHVKLMRSRQNRWIVIGAFSANATTGSTDAGSSNVTNNILGAPSSITATGVSGGILVTWENPGSALLIFEIEYANDTAGTGAVTKRVAGGSYLIPASAGVTRYAHVRSVDSNWNRSGWTDWVSATVPSSGGVTSVGLTMPSDYSVASSPVTGAGTIGVTYANQTQNKVLASPNGSTGTPSFRALTRADLPVLPGCRVYHNANQSINNTFYTSLAFNNESYDTDTMHDTVTNNGRITIKTAGVYLLSAVVSFAFNTTGDRQVLFVVNGATYIAYHTTRAASNGDTIIPLTVVRNFAVNDYIECQVYQDSGGAINVLAGGSYSPYFSAQYLSA